MINFKTRFFYLFIHHGDVIKVYSKATVNNSVNNYFDVVIEGERIKECGQIYINYGGARNAWITNRRVFLVSWTTEWETEINLDLEVQPHKIQVQSQL